MMKTAILCAAILPAFGCVELTAIEPAARSVLPEAIGGASAESSERAFVGLELEEPAARSLEEIEVAEGLVAARVAPGSPAAAAGIRAGDRVMAADGVRLERLDQWQALLDAHAPGSNLTLEIESEGALRTAPLAVAKSGGGRAAATRFAERVKLRAILETEPGGARVVSLLPQSPAPDAGVEPGDLIVAIDGRPVTGAEDVIARVSERAYGEAVSFEIEKERARRRVDVELWSPPRVMTGLAVPILFHFDRDLDADRTEFALVDLWVLALYDYRKDGLATRHRILRFFRFESDAGRLTEEAGEPRRDETTPDAPESERS